jgi:hypothetical protein
MWEQLDAEGAGLSLPMYGGGSIQPRPAGARVGPTRAR